MTPVEELVWKLIRPTRILIVESADGDLSSLSTALESGYECVLDSAQTVAKALERLAQWKYDVVFVAPVLADGTAADIMRAIRFSRPPTPVVLIGSKSDADRVLEVAGSGFIGLVQRPLTEDTVQQVFSAYRIPARSRAEKSVMSGFVGAPA